VFTEEIQAVRRKIPTTRTKDSHAAEHAFEANVLLELPRGLIFQPVVQYYMNCGGSSLNAVVHGFHTRINSRSGDLMQEDASTLPQLQLPSNPGNSNVSSKELQDISGLLVIACVFAMAGRRTQAVISYSRREVSKLAGGGESSQRFNQPEPVFMRVSVHMRGSWHMATA
jgi:hypothetical protein